MGAKRKADESGGAASKSAKQQLVNPKRMRELKGGDVGDGPVIYWMSRDQRMRDNWALLYAAEQAQARGARLAVCFNLLDKYLVAGARQFGFMLRGLKELAPRLEAANIRFHLLRGEAKDTVPELVKDLDAALLVADQSPMRPKKQWAKDVSAAIDVPFHEVDAHNIVPVWVASDKREYAARTIRRKIHDQLGTFLEEFPELPELAAWEGDAPEIDWDARISDALESGKEVPEVDIASGEDAAHEALATFTGKSRLKQFASGRNDPVNLEGVSGLSPYYHFGQLAAQRAALEVKKHKKAAPESVDSFLEESIVRRELSDNFCFYEDNYDSLSCASGWARESLAKHAKDKREHVYTLEQLEKGETHDDLWNAAQHEMVHIGKMHGFMRMYWGKKILEWTESPEQALEYAIYLNDKYELDGRDPNGWVGCMWSICGIHDQGWAERDVFGKVRYMNYNGCKRKFDIEGYCENVKKRIEQEQKAKK